MDLHIGLVQPIVQHLHQRLRLGRLRLARAPGFFQRLHLLLDALDLLAADGDFLVQALPTILMALDTRAQIGRLFSEDGDFFLALRNRVFYGLQLIAQGLAGAFSIGNAPVEFAELFAQLAPFALAREDSGLRVMGADGQRAVRFQ